MGGDLYTVQSPVYGAANRSGAAEGACALDRLTWEGRAMRGHRASRTSRATGRVALGVLVATSLVAACSGQEPAAPPPTTSPPVVDSAAGLQAIGPAQAEPIDHPLDLGAAVAPFLAGWVDVGKPVVGAEVRVVDATGTSVAGPITTDDSGFFVVDVAQVPTDARVVATGGTTDGTPFTGTLSALVDRQPDGSAAPTTITAATTLQVAHVDAAPGTSADAAATAVRTELGVSDPTLDLGLPTAVADEAVVPQEAFVAQATANGGFDTYVGTLSRTTPPGPPGPVPPAVPAVPVGRGSLAVSVVWPAAKVLGSIILEHAGQMVVRELGYDSNWNKLLEISSELQSIQTSLVSLNSRFEAQAQAADANQFFDHLRDLNTSYLNGVNLGSKALQQMADSGAALAVARDGGGSTTGAEHELEVATRIFRNECANRSYLEVPGALATDFRGEGSLLQRYVDVVMRGQRFMTTSDSEALQAFFDTYYGYALLALRLATECLTLDEGGPAYAEAVRNVVWNGTFFHSAGQLNTDLGALPRIVPPPIPEGLVIDATTGSIWLDDTAVGTAPFDQRAQYRSLPTRLATTPGDAGPLPLELASLPEVQALVQLGAPLPRARVNRPEDGGRRTFADALPAYLRQIGLGTVADVGLGPDGATAIWTSTESGRIIGCYAPFANTVCNTRPRPVTGSTAAVVRSPDASVRVWPQACALGACDYTRQPLDVSYCTGFPSSACVSESAFATYRGAGLYRYQPADQANPGYPYLRLNRSLS